MIGAILDAGAILEGLQARRLEMEAQRRMARAQQALHDDLMRRFAEARGDVIDGECVVVEPMKALPAPERAL